jgi:hypothetical protein
MNDMRSRASRKAMRSLRWYPAAWRERFGDEFVALVEDEIAEHPKSARRTLNVAWKGSVARLADLGLVGQTPDPARQIRAGSATTLLFGLLFAVCASKLWGPAMITWHESNYGQSSWLLTLLTALITISLGAIGLILAFGLLIVLGSALFRIARGQGQGLRVPAVLLLASVGYLVVASHIALRYVIAVGGIAWGHPGVAIKQVAGASYSVIAHVESAATNSASFTSLDGVIVALAPVVLIVFVASAMSLIRRSLISPSVDRFGRLAMVSLLGLMLTFIATYLLWRIAGGAAKPDLWLNPQFPFLQWGVSGFLAIGSGVCVTRIWQQGVDQSRRLPDNI